MLSKFSIKEKIGLGIAVGCVVIALVDRCVIGPITNKIHLLNREIKAAEKELRVDLRNVSQKAVVSRVFQQYRQYVTKVGSDEEEVARILGTIEELARKSSVYLIVVKPLGSAGQGSPKKYTVEIEAEGNIESIITFVYQLNTSTQLLRLEKLTLNLKQKDSMIFRTSIIVTKILIS